MTSMTCLLSLLIQSVFITASCGGQPPLSRPTFAPAEGDASSTIPFDLIDNRIFIDVKLNGKPFRVMFDSGAGYIITPEVAQGLGLKVQSAGRSGGVGERTVETGRAQIADMQVGDRHIRDHDFSVISFADAPSVFGSARIDGVIGAEVLERFVAKVDYEHRRLTLTEPERFEYRGGGIALPFERPRMVPLVEGEIDGVTGKFGIDTGARSSLLLFGPFTDENNLRTKYAPAVEGITGWGIGGPVRSQVTRVKLLKLGGVEARNVVTRLPLQRGGDLTTSKMAGLVGADVLKQFDLIFDYGRKRIIFEKNRNYGAPDTFDRAGMWLGLDGKSFAVVDVIKGGPAAEAGVEVGDHILAVDGRPAERLDLLAIRLRFKDDPPGERVHLTVLSGGKKREIVIVLRDLV